MSRIYSRIKYDVDIENIGLRKYTQHALFPVSVSKLHRAYMELNV